MKIAVIGGGPGGLYFSLLAKKASPARDITVIERNPPDATYGWGVVFADRRLTAFREADYKSYKEITDHFVLWDAIDVRYRGEVQSCGGHVFAGLSRKRLLNILQRRCEELGVRLIFEQEVGVLSAFGRYDLLVAADGINSGVRNAYAQVFKPRLDVHRTKYIWYGTTRLLDAFTFIFRENDHGVFTVHAYPFDGQTSTFIVECDVSSWGRAGLDEASEAESLAYCERLFAGDLEGRALMSNNSRWINFVTVRNQTWRHGNIVLLGDAAHTAHFSVGSGTMLAMEDAISLANAFDVHGEDVEAALTGYELERRPVVEALQEAASESSHYFEHVRRYVHLDPLQFTFHLLTRSGRIDYENLRLRDPLFVAAVDGWFAGTAVTSIQAAGTQIVAPSRLFAPPPLFAPLRLRGLRPANRVVLSPPPTYSAEDGEPQDRQLVDAARRGAGLVMTEIVAVSPDGRITPGCAGLYRPEHVSAWRRLVEAVRATAEAPILIQLGHAGRRGSTRPRGRGLDRPLLTGNWPLLSASALPYTSQSQIPKEMDRDDMDRGRDDFTRAASMADEAGFDMIQLHMAHGYLLASFMSPLTNLRADTYGGTLENRMRFPLEVFDAVRATWPADKPMSVAISATDWVRGGFGIEDAVAVAQVLGAHGCDVIEVLAGQTTIDARPTYGRLFLTPLSDRVRNEAGVCTMAAGGITTASDINTILAAGRADLCVMDPPL